MVLARPHWTAVARGTLVPGMRLDHDHVAGALALLGTTVTTYMYLWQTVEQVEQPAVRWRVKLRQFDAIAGTALASAVFWAILVASGATLGAQHNRWTPPGRRRRRCARRPARWPARCSPSPCWPPR